MVASIDIQHLVSHQHAFDEHSILALEQSSLVRGQGYSRERTIFLHVEYNLKIHVPNKKVWFSQLILLKDQPKRQFGHSVIIIVVVISDLNKNMNFSNFEPLNNL